MTNMTVWTKTITSLTLICYIAVASVASAHAFPSSSSTIGSSQKSLNISLSDMGPSCHQVKVDTAESNVLSACKIFCAAMSNIIIGDITVYLRANDVSTEIAFLRKDISKLTLDMEPHPPK